MVSARPLRPEEQRLIEFLLASLPANGSVKPPGAKVVDMADGGMGSIRFAGPDGRRFGRELVKAQYVDADGVLVSITVNLDNKGELFEIDFWKVDFAPLRQYPNPEQLTDISSSPPV